MANDDAGRLTEFKQVIVFGAVLGVVSGIVSGTMAGLLILAFNNGGLPGTAHPVLFTFLGSILGGLLLSLIVWIVFLLFSRQAPEFFSWPTETLTQIFSKPQKGGSDEKS